MYGNQPPIYSQVNLSRSRQFQDSPNHYQHQQQSRINEYQYQNQNSYNTSFIQNPEYREPIKTKDPFEFGKEQIKISNYVTQQLNKDQQNKKILQRFRLQAIRHRNQKYQNHVGSNPYITESMVPGASIDASQYAQKPVRRPPPQIIEPPPRRFYHPKPQLLPIVHQTLQPSPIKRHSIGVTVDFQKQFPLRKLRQTKKKKKKSQYTLEKYEQEKSFNKINSMLHDMNSKILYNRKLLEDSCIKSFNQSLIIRDNPEKRYYHRFSTQQTESGRTKLPTVEYDTSKLRLKTIGADKQDLNNKKIYIKDHLQLLNKNKKRLEDLDGYIYQY